MKTICTLNGKVIMSQDGEAIEAMEANAAQYPGAVASVVTDEEFAALNAPVRDVKAEIAAMEYATLTGRGTREFMLYYFESNFTPEQLAANPGYQKAKLVDNQIKALRSLL